MTITSRPKIRSILELYESISGNEKLIVDILRHIIRETLPIYCKEKISYNVPYFFGNKGICIVWPSSIPRGGIKEGVLLGFWQGNKLRDKDQYLSRGTNKKIYYKIFKSVEEIDPKPIIDLLDEALLLDKTFK